MSNTLARLYLTASICGTVAIVALVTIMKIRGYTPHVIQACPHETYMFVKVLIQGSSLLCLFTAAASALYAFKLLFVEPLKAVRPFFKAAAVLALAVLMPTLFGLIAQRVFL